MGIPSITERKHYRLVPGDPEEPTSTIVLTSKDSYFVDIRLVSQQYQEEKSKGLYTLACVDWAFAGKSQSKAKGKNEGGALDYSHSVWDHWIDSRSDKPGIDEGDMWLQDNGDVLERGKQVDPATGAETEYEELWHDLEVVRLGKKQNRNSLVLNVNNPESGYKGMAVKVGGWCQAIMKAGDELTIERWKWKPAGSVDEQNSVDGSSDEKKTDNGWERTFGVGKATLPCELMCSHTSGKIGLNATQKYQIDDNWENVAIWKVLEEYYW